MDYLSDIEKEKINQFLSDSAMCEAVRKVLLSGVYSDGVMVPGKPADPLKNFILGAFSNATSQLLSFEEKGRKIDTIMNAISLVESGFKELEKMKKIESPLQDVKNPAR